MSERERLVDDVMRVKPYGDELEEKDAQEKLNQKEQQGGDEEEGPSQKGLDGRSVVPAFAAAPETPPPSDALKELLAERRSIWLVRGKEQLEATYWSAERGYDRDQYLQICWALRDIQADRVFPIDPRSSRCARRPPG